MNSFITLTCLLAVVGLSCGSAIGLGYGYGYGAPILAPAISTANLVKAAPIPIIRTAVAPIITAPVIKTVAPVSIGYGLGSYGWGGHSLGGYGWGGHSLGGYGLGGYGLGGHGLGGYGLARAYGGWGSGLGNWGWSKH
ncbi:shematrin-like protein 2 [Bombyx mandarina]|uniref:Shematrin-like protein 2 n=1 Tax=Bombyx mandarina TaxID=7092 RepID=A0A6J2K039_BOMMA|nr:shematrin-like protein 2 [Bombyx mandarina]